MKFIPILFSIPMVQAINEDRKTMTRRVVKPQPPNDFEYLGTDTDKASGVPIFYACWEGDKFHNVKCPYGQIGDVLDPCIYIQGFNSMYCASLNGNIYSKARGEWKLLKPFSGHKGYLNVTLMDGKRKTTRNVHTLVCSAFHGIQEPNMQVRHLDGNPQNNCALNLKWGTQAENWQDRKAHNNGIEGEKHHGSNFTDLERSHITWAIEKGLCSQRHAARVLGVSQQNIWQMCHPERLIEPTIQEPKADCRTFLEITNIRVERLNDISEQEAIAEGIESWIEKRLKSEPTHYRVYVDYDNPTDPATYSSSPIDSFQTLWQSINGKDSWEANPFVWVISFKRIEKPENFI